jgi:hypothetical protein
MLQLLEVLETGHETEESKVLDGRGGKTEVLTRDARGAKPRGQHEAEQRFSLLDHQESWFFSFIKVFRDRRRPKTYIFACHEISGRKMAGNFARFASFLFRVFICEMQVSSHSYGLSAETFKSYQPVFRKFVERFDDDDVFQADIRAHRIPAQLLTDSNIAIFLEEQWGEGIAEGTFKKIRAALQSAHQGEGLGELDWSDSSKFPKTWLQVKVCAQCFR